MIELNRREFERLVQRALDELPPPYAGLVHNLFVVVEDEPSDDDFASVGLDPEHDDLLGLYEGVPLDDRGAGYAALPDRVVLFRYPILAECETRAEVVAEVRDTLIHELGHHFGLDDDNMPY